MDGQAASADWSIQNAAEHNLARLLRPDRAMWEYDNGRRRRLSCQWPTIGTNAALSVAAIMPSLTGHRSALAAQSVIRKKTPSVLFNAPPASKHRSSPNNSRRRKCRRLVTDTHAYSIYLRHCLRLPRSITPLCLKATDAVCLLLHLPHMRFTIRHIATVHIFPQFYEN